MPLLGMACNPVKRLRALSILGLALLAPDVVEAILAGRTDQALMLERLSSNCQRLEEQRRIQLDQRANATFDDTPRRAGGSRLPVLA